MAGAASRRILRVLGIEALRYKSSLTSHFDYTRVAGLAAQRSSPWKKRNKCCPGADTITGMRNLILFLAAAGVALAQDPATNPQLASMKSIYIMARTNV